jgi:ribonuclease T1
MMRKFVWGMLVILVAAFAAPSFSARTEQQRIGTVSASSLPREAQQTIAVIKKGGPYPYKRDGIVFGNFEKRLPPHPRGYYHEFTVPTPGSRDRAARRIISGKAGELYYTDDHYETFRRVLE